MNEVDSRFSTYYNPNHSSPLHESSSLLPPPQLSASAPQPAYHKQPTNLTLPDQNDESLKKWKESLGLGAGKDISNPNDPRKCIIISLGLEVEGRPDIIIDLKAPGAVEALKDKPFTIKEGASFRMKAKFQVQHQILSGMKYLQVVKRMGVSHKLQEMIVRIYTWDIEREGWCGLMITEQGSFSPNTEEKPFYEKKCAYLLYISTHETETTRLIYLHSRTRNSSQRHDRPRPLHCRL